MEPATIAAVGALATAVVSLTFQGVKFIQELRDRASRAADQTTKSEAERDSVVVKSAEGALLLMQGMLDLARASNTELNQSLRESNMRIAELEKENREKALRIQSLEEANQRLEGQMRDLQVRMGKQEGGE